MMGTSRGSDLRNPDTDGDGIPDGSDPEPLYPINPGVPHISDLTELNLHSFGTIRGPTATAQLHLAWTDSALYLSSVSTTPVNLLLQIDANNDGWFHGFDNIQIRILNSHDSATVADYYLRDCSSWVDPPEDRRDILRKRDLRIIREMLSESNNETPGSYRLVVCVPRNDKYGFRLQKGHQFGIRIGVQSTTDLWMWDELFERNYMMPLTLK
jgi:hypothetical protein